MLMNYMCCLQVNFLSVCKGMFINEYWTCDLQKSKAVYILADIAYFKFQSKVTASNIHYDLKCYSSALLNYQKEQKYSPISLHFPAAIQLAHRFE